MKYNKVKLSMEEREGKRSRNLVKKKLNTEKNTMLCNDFAACFFVRTCLFGWNLKMKYLN